MANRMKKGKIYIVHWSDTFAVSRWRSLEELEKEAKEAESYIKSIGFYIGDFGTKKEYEVIASSLNTNPLMEDWGMVTYIPKGTIKKVQLLKE